MSVSSYDAVVEKVLYDLESAIKKYPQINEFYIIPTAEEENKNRSPVIKGENTLGLESWIVTHIYPYAHYQIMQKNNYKTQNLCKMIPCLTGVSLLNPEMPTVWNRRRELIISKKLHPDNELRLTRMALSRKPKCNDALIHRRWIITELLKDVQDKSGLLAEELHLSEMIANRYHSNYHAWSHRMWSMQHLLPDSPFYSSSRRKASKNHFYETISVEFSDVLNRSITRNELSFICDSETSQIYFKELENNSKWISSHVSDHSGLHFRKFLITEILSFMKNYLIHSNKMEIQNELDDVCLNYQSVLVSNSFSLSRFNLMEFLGSFNFANSHKKAVEKHLIHLEQELTLFDVGMFMIVKELEFNNSLLLLFLNHEALWYYRRFLIFMYKQLIDAYDYCKCGRERRFLHLDNNGVPCKKDFKFGNVESSESTSEHSDLYLALHARLISSEEESLSKITSQDDHVKSLLRNYNDWFKHFFSI